MKTSNIEWNQAEITKRAILHRLKLIIEGCHGKMKEVEAQVRIEGEGNYRMKSQKYLQTLVVMTHGIGSIINDYDYDQSNK
tara:strand:+ start:576 stop:818 length:243 start_codon:yes stop_codon:yes gene_type:complete